jgi:calnexin
MFWLSLSFCLSSPTFPLHPDVLPFHFESFTTSSFSQRWHASKLPNYTGRFRVAEAPVPRNYKGEKMLFAQKENAYYALSTKFDTPFRMQEGPLIVQYETRFTKPLECGGAYIKFFADPNFDPQNLCNETKHVIMFGPDKCGDDNHVRFIFQHRDLRSRELREIALRDTPAAPLDRINHLYTLILRPNNTFEIWLDASLHTRGHLFDGFDPGVNPPKTFDDPSDHQPPDWVDIDQIADPNARKPEDWDDSEPEYLPDPEKSEIPADWLVNESKYIPDPNGRKPDDWDDELQGEWEPTLIANPKCQGVSGCGPFDPPMIENPNYKGEWSPPMVPNPAYKGEWKPRQIPNPDYYEDSNPYAQFPNLVGAGFEVWLVNREVAIGNVYIGQDEAALHKWNEEHFKVKFAQQEEKLKKLEDEERARMPVVPKDTTPSSAKHRDGGAFRDFLLNIQDAFELMYDESPEIVIVVLIAVVALPLGYCLYSRVATKKKKLTREQIALRKKKAAERKAKKQNDAKDIKTD